MDVTKADLLRLQNVARLVKQAEFKLTGEEIPAAHQAVAWIGEMLIRIEEAIKSETPKVPVQPAVPEPPAKPAKGRLKR